MTVPICQRNICISLAGDVILGYLRSHNCNFRSPLMKTLDWSVETLGLDYNSTGLCNHLFKPEYIASETYVGLFLIWSSVANSIIYL
jgi:hypothetical protein